MLVVFSFDSEFKIKKVIWIIKMLELEFSINVVIIIIIIIIKKCQNTIIKTNF